MKEGNLVHKTRKLWTTIFQIDLVNVLDNGTVLVGAYRELLKD